MKTEHTAGPWEVWDEHYEVYAGVKRNEPGQIVGAFIASLTDAAEDGDLDEYEVEANAHLIAAAPDLLAACEKALNSGAIKFANNALDRGIREDLEAAIKKARGE